MNLPPICNRSADGKFSLPEGGWIHLIPKGEYPHPESGKLQVLDDAALTAIVNRFVAESKVANFAGLLIDQEHWSYDPERSSESFGWIKELQNRDNGIWARVDWTALGETAVQGGTYRFVSPTWLPNQVEHLGNNRIRPLRLDSAGLTNSPNLKGMVPFNNRQPGTGTANKPNETKRMKTVATALGLSPDASEEAILAEVTKLLSASKASKTEVETMSNRVTTLQGEITALKTENGKLVAAQVEQDLEMFKNRFAPEKKEYWRTALLANRANVLELLGSIPEPAAPGGAQQQQQQAAQGAMHNRAAAQTPNGGANPGADTAKKSKDEARAKKIANRASEIAVSQKVPFSQAWNMAKGEFPAEV